MQTNFSARQLRDPEIAEAAAIIGTCVHYGFCTNTCPTYVLTRDENESPRGRIDLIRAMLERGGAPDARTVRHLDNCLSCLSCMTTCAVKVDYVHLIDRARAHIERHFRRPLADRVLRFLLAKTIPEPKRLLRAMQAARFARPLRGLLPVRLKAMLDMVPDRADAKILAPQVFKAEGMRRKRVALLAGCAQQALSGNINAATIRLLTRHGCEVVVAQGGGCCGSLTLHMGREREAKASARCNVAAWTREIEGEGLDAIVVNASGCGTTVKDYGHLFAQDECASAARRVASLARDVSEVLCELGLPVQVATRAWRVAYHDPCSMQHGQRVTREPRALLAAAGFRIADVPEGHFCCGSAGTYNLLQPQTAETLGRRKAGHVASTDPDIVATGNIGCIMQLRRYLDIPVVHSVELLDWATGGPRPPALEGRILREPAQEKSVPGAPAEGAANDIGIW
ncbi:MAG: glycolate oxidase subunit GlcF [Pseudorhodoplanes sp.]|nr:glycolate oxidase subunit GlcF [Pseudorhodoplanes sp.]